MPVAVVAAFLMLLGVVGGASASHNDIQTIVPAAGIVGPLL